MKFKNPILSIMYYVYNIQDRMTEVLKLALESEND